MPRAQAIAASLKQGERKAVLLGNLAQHHPRYAELHALAQQVAELAGAKFGFLGEAANSVGAHLAGAVPSDGGMNAAQMLDDPRRAYILLGVEAELDSYNPTRTLAALQAAQLVVVLSAYKNKALDYAHVLLPVAPFTETSGTFVNTEGRVQSFNAVVKPLGETRPGWKVLRVLGNLMEVAGFDYDSAEQVRAEVLAGDITAKLNNSLQSICCQAGWREGRLAAHRRSAGLPCRRHRAPRRCTAENCCGSAAGRLDECAKR